MEQPPIVARPKKKGILGLIVVLIIIAVVGFCGYQLISSTIFARQLPAGDASILFSDTGVQERFILSHSALLAQPKSRVGEASILESVELSVPGEKAVLALVPGTPGVVLGKLHGNGNFEPVLSDGTQKVDLQVTHGDVAIYSVLASPVIWLSSEPVALDSEPPAADDIHGEATGPIDLGAEYKNVSVSAVPREAMLYAYNFVKQGSPAVLGAGKSPRIRADGSLIAIASDGIVQINTMTGTRSLLLSYKGGNAVGSTVSSGGRMVLLRSEGNSVSDAYSVSGDKATFIGSIVSLVPIFGASFADDSHIFLRTARGSVSLYTLPGDVASLKPPTAHLSIIAPKE